MERKSYSYNKSFIVELTYCDSCKSYYNKNEVHNCTNIPVPHIDILKQLIENTKPKEKKVKRKIK